MQRNSTTNFFHSSYSAEHRLEKLLAEHVEMAYPHYSFAYDRTPSHNSNHRPDVLIKENSRNRKTVVWHETDEWEHSDRPAGSEVLREKGLLLELNTGNCQIHLIRCSPYEGRKTTGSEFWNKQYSVSSVLSSFRLILDILDHSPTMALSETVTLNHNSKMFIYYINYSRARINSLKLVRSQLREQHPACPSHAELPQHAPQTDAQSSTRQAQHGVGPFTGHYGAQSQLAETAGQSQQQQQPSQGAHTGTASAQTGTSSEQRAVEATKAVPTPVADPVGGISHRPLDIGKTKPVKAAKAAKISAKPPKLPRSPAQNQQGFVVSLRQAGSGQGSEGHVQLQSGTAVQTTSGSPINAPQVAQQGVTRQLDLPRTSSSTELLQFYSQK